MIFWVLLFAILFSQGTWLFLDARKRGANPWVWGLWGCIQCPTPLVVYWLFVCGGLHAIKQFLKWGKS
ncbi:MAG: sigmaY antisigma factor component [Gorillibacterium sp.]|nr:sigmaY antisigma factor component [Gorillibacterium sp.]